MDKIKKTLHCSILSSKKQGQYESNTVNNTAKNTRSVQEMEYTVCLTLTRPQATQFCTFMFSQQQKHHIKKVQKTLNIKNIFLHLCYISIQHRFWDTADSVGHDPVQIS